MLACSESPTQTKDAGACNASFGECILKWNAVSDLWL